MEVVSFMFGCSLYLLYLRRRNTSLSYLPPASTNAKVSSIVVYPVKGGKAVELKSVTITKYGFLGDRRWLIVDSSNVFMTQRRMRKLALLDAQIDFDKTGKVINGIKLSMNGESIKVPVIRKEKKTVTVWTDTITGTHDQGKEVGKWLSKQLNKEGLSLVFMGDNCERKMNPKYAVDKNEDVVSFADGAPVLLTSTDSLCCLNNKMENELGMDRFRPNVVVQNITPFEEDSWHHIQIGNANFANVKPCNRCIVTTIDQTTAKMHGLKNDPIKTLKTFRQDSKGEVYFGVNLIPIKNKDSEYDNISIGDQVQVLTRKPWLKLNR